MLSQADISNQKVSTKHSPGKTKHKPDKRQKPASVAETDGRTSYSGKRKRLSKDDSRTTRKRQRLEINVPGRTPKSDSCLAGTPQLTSSRLLQDKFTSPDRARYPWTVKAALLPLKTTTSTRILRSDTSKKKFLGNIIGIHDKINYKIPRYLFRMWHPASAGGRLRHTVTSITPHGFLNGKKGHASIWDIEYDDFTWMINKHIIHGYQSESEFTSWSPSLTWVLLYAANKAKSAFIAMIDTEELRATNAIFWVPRLVGKYPEEYLVHGPIRDWRTKRQKMRNPYALPYTAVPYLELVSRGLLTCYPFLDRPPSPYLSPYLSNPGPFRDETLRPVTMDEVRALRHVAAAFPKPFSFIFTIALVTLIPRSSDPNSIPQPDLDTIIRALGPSTFDYLIYSQTPSLFNDFHVDKIVVEPESPKIIRDAGNFMDVRQMVALMKGLFWKGWGKGDGKGLEGLEGSTPTTPGHW